MGFVRRDFAFHYWLWEKLVKVVEERAQTVNQVVSEAVAKYLEETLLDEEAEKLRLLAERNKLLVENNDLFLLQKRVSRDGAYVVDAAKCVLLGDEGLYERWQKKADGIWNRMTVEERDFQLRAFAKREKNMRRIVEIERGILPLDKLDMSDVEKGWRLTSKKRRLNVS